MALSKWNWVAIAIIAILYMILKVYGLGAFVDVLVGPAISLTVAKIIVAIVLIVLVATLIYALGKDSNFLQNLFDDLMHPISRAADEIKKMIAALGESAANFLSGIKGPILIGGVVLGAIFLLRR